MTALCLAGCGSAPQKKTTKPTPEKEKPLLAQPLTVNSPHGEATVRGLPPERDIHYHLVWNEARIDVGNQGVFAGTMEGVSGEFYEKSQIASYVKSEHAKAERESGLLTLSGNVTVVSRTHDATLRCDKVEWDDKDKIVKAFGNVQILGTQGTLSGLNEVWASPKLDYFSTPSMYRKP